MQCYCGRQYRHWLDTKLRRAQLSVLGLRPVRRIGLLAFVGAVLVGCGASGPSDSDQQKLAKEYSPENVAAAYDKAGKHKEAEEVRKTAAAGQQGGQQPW